MNVALSKSQQQPLAYAAKTKTEEALLDYANRQLVDIPKIGPPTKETKKNDPKPLHEAC